MKGTGNSDAIVDFPFNQYFPFFIVLLFASMVFASFFPKSMDSQSNTAISLKGKTNAEDGQAFDHGSAWEKNHQSFYALFQIGLAEIL